MDENFYRKMIMHILENQPVNDYYYQIVTEKILMEVVKLAVEDDRKTILPIMHVRISRRDQGNH